MSRLAIVTTHPIQYYAPVFQKLAQANPDTMVFYTWGKDSIIKFDPDFGKEIEWDIPLLEGYRYTFLTNTSKRPGTSSFRGIVNPEGVSTIEKFRPDAILVYGWSWQSHLQIIRHFSGKTPVWFRGDSNCLDHIMWHKEIARTLLLRWIYRHIDLAFYVGKENHRYYRRYGLKEKQLRFAPHAVDNERYSVNTSADAKRVRVNLQIPEDGNLILFAGKFEPKKDPLTLLRAFERMKADNAYLLFVGNGLLEEELKAMVERSSKKEFIRLQDFQNQSAMPAFYKAAQLFCLPSAGPGETWGLSVNEAMAAGKPVVVSDKVGCAQDLVKANVNGAIFQHGNEADLATKLESIFTAKEWLDRFGQASKQLIENWSFDRQVSSILEELKRLQ